MERAVELENLRQKVLRLAPGSLAMAREDAVALIAELQETGQQIQALRDGLRQVLDESQD
jgi:hypothetical protein